VAEFDDGNFGNAVLSRHPLRLVATGSLPGWKSISRLEDRGVLWVEVDLGGSQLQVMNTHLSILDQERRMQVDALLSEQWLRNPDLEGPVVLCGDFNASGRSRTLRRLDSVLRNVGTTSGNGSDPRLHTWSSRLPMRRIDHLFASEELRVQSIHVPRNRLTQVASDHLPLVVDLWCPHCDQTVDEDGERRVLDATSTLT
jgi:endonuclease/exonuclease/phosphatase family metal-dependent hydrolase